VTGLRSGSALIEVGPRTGQATRPWAERGLQVRAVELDGRLAARVAPSLARFRRVVVTATSFEAWDPRERHSMRCSPVTRSTGLTPDVHFVKAAAVLKPHGHLVVISTPVVVPMHADRFWWDVQDDWVAVGAERVWCPPIASRTRSGGQSDVRTPRAWGRSSSGASARPAVAVPRCRRPCLHLQDARRLSRSRSSMPPTRGRWRRRRADATLVVFEQRWDLLGEQDASQARPLDVGHMEFEKSPAEPSSNVPKRAASFTRTRRNSVTPGSLPSCCVPTSPSCSMW
jgi:hypothetical protein